MPEKNRDSIERHTCEKQFDRERIAEAMRVAGGSLSEFKETLQATLPFYFCALHLDRRGHGPFAAWSDSLNKEAAAKVAAALARIQHGNFSKAKGVGAGVYGYRIDFGPGYRIYFGKDGERLVILLGGGTKNAITRTSRQ